MANVTEGPVSVSVLVPAGIRREMERRKRELGQSFGWQVSRALRFWFANGGK